MFLQRLTTDMANSQPQLSLAGNKRCVSDIEPDEEHGAAILEPKRSCVRRIGEGKPGCAPEDGRDELDGADEKPEPVRYMKSASHQSRPQLQQNPTQALQSLPDFLSFDQPLPPNVSLHKLCHFFPNHLFGKNLERLIIANWSAKDIYLQMQSKAKNGLSLEDLQARWDQKKREMNDQKQNTDALNLTSQPSQQFNTCGAKFKFPTLSTSLSVDELNKKVVEEIKGQKELVIGALRSLSPTGAEDHWSDIWSRRAERWETEFKEEYKITEEDIPSDKSSMRILANRHYALLRKWVQSDHTPPTEMDPDQVSLYFDIVNRRALEVQWETLQKWTKEFEQEFGSCQREQDRVISKDRSLKPVLSSASSARDYAGSSKQAPELYATTPKHECENIGEKVVDRIPNTTQATKHGDEHGPGSFDTGIRQVHQSRHAPSHSSRIRSLERDETMEGMQQNPFSPHPAWQAHHHGSQIGNGYVPQAHWVGPASGQTGAALHIPPVPWATQAAISKQLDLSANTTNSQPPVNFLSHQPTAPTSAAPPTTKKRGAPRRKFFTAAPSADTPLPALLTDAQILNLYPEHLQKTDVMKRFVASSGTRLGGWPTRDMVESLSHHQIAGDGNALTRLTEEQRKAKIRKWVVKERDSCNKQLKSMRKSRSQPASAAAAPAPAPAQVNSQAPATTISTSVAPQRVHTPSSVATTSAPPQAVLQAPQGMMAPPSHPTSAYSPSSLSIDSSSVSLGASRSLNCLPEALTPPPYHPSNGIDHNQDLAQLYQEAYLDQFTGAGNWPQEVATSGMVDTLATMTAAGQDATGPVLPSSNEKDATYPESLLLDMLGGSELEGLPFEEQDTNNFNWGLWDEEFNAQTGQDAMNYALQPSEIGGLFPEVPISQE